ncbi:uncharacterized protein [Magallana gigas]|uniref:uncharacterized protein isoform X2 n=1 Tax=Magallana gigas TaxID=29159 RepID=UPI00334029D7
MEMDAGLNFIDHMETKESLPDRPKVLSPDKKKMFFVEEMKNDMNGNPNTIKEGEDGGLEKDASQALLEELRLSESSIGMENKVLVTHSLEDSGFEEKESRPEMKQNFLDDGEERTVETSVGSKSHKKDYHSLFEFTSASSMFLSTEKVTKGGERSSELKKDELMTDSNIKDVASPRSLQSEMIKQSLQPKEFSSPVKQDVSNESNVSIEEDDEKVIIHLDSNLDESTNGSSKVTPLQPVEVERKFKVTADTKIKLVEIGAELHKEKVFLDKYFDNPDYSLTLKDCWLRQRNESWELKVVNGQFTKLASQYQEITETNEIADFLVNHFHRLDLKGLAVDLVIKKLDLQPFVEYTTTRQTYFLPECIIDLDLTDFGYQVGEIEVMATDKSQIPRALETITSVAGKLGFETFQM